MSERLSDTLALLSISSSFRRYSPVSPEIVEKPNNCNNTVLAPNIFGRDDPDLSGVHC